MEIKEFKDLLLKFQKENLYCFSNEELVKEVYNIHPVNVCKLDVDFTKKVVTILTDKHLSIWFQGEHIKELCEEGFCVRGGNYFCLGEEGCISALFFHNNRVFNKAKENIESSKQAIEKIKELDKNEFKRQWDLYFRVFE